MADQSQAKRRFRLRDVVEDRRLALMLALGFSSGLPIFLVFGTLSAWFADMKVAVASIGLLSYVSLAYSLKFVWAPVVDRVDVPVLTRWLGRRRAWMLTAQLVIAGGLVAMSFGDPTRNVLYLAFCALVVAFASATQDIVVDGWRINAAPTERQGVMLAAYQLGYTVATRACAGAGAFYLAAWSSWPTAYLVMAVLMLVGIGGCLAAPRIDRVEAAPAGRDWRDMARTAVVEPFADLLRRYGLRLALILPLVALFRLPDFVSGVMAQPLYFHLGFSKVEIASITKVFGVIVSLTGAFVGGWAVGRIGLRHALLIGGAAAAASHLSFALLATRGHDTTYLIIGIICENFASAFAGTVLMAYMSSLTSPLFAATQYALLSSLYALPGKLVGGLSGYMVEALGFPTFFVMTSLIGIPVVVLCLMIVRSGGRDAAGESDGAPQAGGPGRGSAQRAGGNSFRTPELASTDLPVTPARAKP